MRDLRRAIPPALAALALAGCVGVPDQQRTLSLRDDGSISIDVRPCGRVAADATASLAAAADLDASALRIATWNLHKGEDAGWEHDLTRIANDHDLVLLQEAMLTDALRTALEGAGLKWHLASAFTLNGRDAGVLTAARVRPVSACAQASLEPLIRIPKAALIERFRLSGHAGTVAVANLHAINFTLSADGAYRDQLDAIAAELAAHVGPIIFAGDFNTWSEARFAAVEEVARGLSLVPIVLDPDLRRRFLGQWVDHIYVRGFDVVRASAPEVTSSDHNPVLTTLRVKAPN